MKKLFTFSLILLYWNTIYGQGVPNKEIQMKSAVMAAPEDMRSDATVWGFNEKGYMIKLREGKNDFVCLADDPNQSGFNVACYHKDLEPFMARGRELKAEGKSGMEIFQIREEEVKAGKLKMPEQPTTLHVLSGNEGKYDPEKGEVVGASYRYVVYIPYATAQSTGLPTSPMVPGGPWIMDPGTHRAHIMITPPREK